jgi:hypothetical protein
VTSELAYLKDDLAYVERVLAGGVPVRCVCCRQEAELARRKQLAWARRERARLLAEIEAAS